MQWGLEYQTHRNTKCFEVRISDGSVLEWSVKTIAIAMDPTNLKINHTTTSDGNSYDAYGQRGEMEKNTE